MNSFSKDENARRDESRRLLPQARFAGVARRIKSPRLRIRDPRREEPGEGSLVLRQTISSSGHGLAGIAQRLAPPKLKIKREILPRKEGPLLAEPVWPEEAANESSEDLSEGGEAIRLDMTRLRKLLNQAGELVIDRNRFAHKVGQAKEMSLALARHRTGLAEIAEKIKSGEGSIEVGAMEMLATSLATAAEDLGELSREMVNLLGSFQQDDEAFLRDARIVQQEIHGLVMQPVGGLFRIVRRVFLEALQTEKKQGNLVFEGEQTLLDKSVIDRLHAPLLHLVRNAVSHGLESPEERESADKPERGTVTVSVRHEAGGVVISVADDGGGLRFDEIIARGKEDGLIADDTEETTELAISLLFHPGFSTADPLLNHGVGLDVVQEEVDALLGSVQVEAKEGKGTKWHLHIPTTLEINEAIIVKVGGMEYALPLNYLESDIQVDEPRLLEHEGKLWYDHGGSEVRAIPLSTVLGLPSDMRAWRGLFVAAGEQRALLVVDAIAGRREIAVKLLNTVLTKSPAFDGGTLNADGQPMLVLNVPYILKEPASPGKMA